MEEYFFLNYDVVGSTNTKDLQKAKQQIESIVIKVSEIIDQKKLNVEERAFLGDGELICFKRYTDDDHFDHPLILSMELHKAFVQPIDEDEKAEKLGLKIGISKAKIEKIDLDKLVLSKNQIVPKGAPFWGAGTLIARRLCDLCDAGHILIDKEAKDSFEDIDIPKQYVNNTFKKYKENFQCLGEYYVKHNFKIPVYNFEYVGDSGLPNFGFPAPPIDKRGLIDKLNLPFSLYKPLSEFHEKHIRDLDDKIRSKNGGLFDWSDQQQLFGSLFRHAKDYWGTNIILPSQYYKSINDYLDYHEEMLSRHKLSNSYRILVVNEDLLRTDFNSAETRRDAERFINWHYHMENGIVKKEKVILLQVDPDDAEKLKEKHQLKSTDVGVWFWRYALQFGPFDKEQTQNELKRRRLWLSHFQRIDEPDYDRNSDYIRCKSYLLDLINGTGRIRINKVYTKKCELQIDRWSGQEVDPE